MTSNANIPTDGSNIEEHEKEKEKEKESQLVVTFYERSLYAYTSYVSASVLGTYQIPNDFF